LSGARAEGLVTVMGGETDELFLQNVMAQANDYSAVQKVSKTFKMVYTPFHGAGHRLVPETLKRLGIKNLICVPEQMVIDGNFPRSPRRTRKIPRDFIGRAGWQRKPEPISF
jgi:phosphoglucomutase